MFFQNGLNQPPPRISRRPKSPHLLGLNRGGINAKTGSEQGKYQPSYVNFYLFIADDSVDVLDAMITNMVHVIDALARFGVLQFGQGGQFSADLSAALLHCEATVDRTRNWRLQVRNDLNRLVDG